MEDQHGASAEARISWESSIVTSDGVPIRLLGSGPARQPLVSDEPAIANDDSLPRQSDSGGLWPPLIPVSVPDLALQISPCLPDDLRQQAIDAVQSFAGPRADVRALCYGGTERIGVWRRPASSGFDNLARAIATEKLEIIQPGETLAFFANSALIGSLAEASWNDQAKRLDGNNKPNPDGPIHLTTFSWSVESPNQVITKIGGYDERPFPDVDFTITIVDTLSIQDGIVSCDSTSSLDADRGWLNFLTAIFIVIDFPLGIFFAYEDIKVGAAQAPKEGGVGCGAAQLVPYEILIPGGLKIVASYSRIAISGGGLFAGGRWSLASRAPQIFIQGDSIIPVFPPVFGGTEPSVSRYFAAATEDLRSPQFSWTADGSVLDPTGQTTAIRFDLTGSRADDRVEKRIAVRATDADGLTAEADRAVFFDLLP